MKPPKPVATGSIPFAAGDETYVYRAYCRCGDLLYVGVTSNVFARMQNHDRALAVWVRRAVRIEWEVYATRLQAERAEVHQIRTLHPIHNTIGRHGRTPRWVALPELPPPPSLEERAIEAGRRLSLGDRL